MDLNNQVTLTDSELTLIFTSLTMTLMSIHKFENESGKKLDIETIKLRDDIKILSDRLEEEYF